MSMDEKFKKIAADPESIKTIFNDLANGGSLITLAQTWEVRYSDLIRWIYEDESRKKLYLAAIDAKQEWAVARLLHEITNISFVDIRKIFNDDHSLKPPHEWPDDVAAAIAGLDVEETFDYEDKKKVQTGWIKKVKLNDKLKAIEMLGRDLGRFVTKHEVTGKLTLEDLVAKANSNDKDQKTQ